VPSHTYQYPFIGFEHQYVTRENRHYLGPFNKPFNNALTDFLSPPANLTNNLLPPQI